MYRIHGDLTICAPIIPGRRSVVEKLLADIDQSGRLDFTLSDTTIQVSIVVLPAQPFRNELLPETLVFATTYVGMLKRHLQELYELYSPVLCDLFQHCAHFPLKEKISEVSVIRFLEKHHTKAAFNSRITGKTKEDITHEKHLRSAIEDLLDEQQVDSHTVTALALKKQIVDFIVSQPGSDWCKKPSKLNLAERLFLWRWLFYGLFLVTCLVSLHVGVYHWFGGIPAFLLFIAVVGLPIVFWRIWVYKISRKKYKSADTVCDEQLKGLAKTQLRPVMNEMTAAGALKQGWLRPLFYFMALRVIRTIAYREMNIPTVSCIRWVSINSRKRMLFLSNYTNTTDFYVRDFLTGETPKGVNFMFTHATGFPDSRNFRYDGMEKDPEGYMNAVHFGQIVTNYWYLHEPLLTCDIIARNTAIRNGLFRKMSETEAREWLQLF